MATRQRLMRVQCVEGKTQSLRRIEFGSDAKIEFERYKTRLRAAHQGPGGNPGVTETWLNGLTYKVETKWR